MGTVPYNAKSTSRAFDAYFHNWERENLAQIFSNTKTPCKGHCGTLYQITDYRLLQCWLGRHVETGLIYNYEELDDEWLSNDLELPNDMTARAYHIGGKHTALTHLLRGVLWQEHFWCTEKLNDWLDSFAPECVFLSFSDDYFINNIALYVAQKYNIPIVSSIGDDYYFNKHFSLNPVYQLYKETYKALIRRVLAWPGSAVFISDKIRDKYNSEFNLDGETVYLASTVQRKAFAPIRVDTPRITYFGNIRMGRNHSLCEIGEALTKINSSYRVEVYSNETEEAYWGILKDAPGIIYGGSISYSEVKNKIRSSDVTIVVEGFKSKDIEQSRYSLSTKAADALASGTAIFAYGSQECGIIEYLQSTNAATVCTNKKMLLPELREIIFNPEMQKRQYQQAIYVSELHHNLQSSTAKFERVIQNALGK